jgi:hypothetical protein
MRVERKEREGEVFPGQPGEITHLLVLLADLLVLLADWYANNH